MSEQKLNTLYQETFAKYSRYPKWRSPGSEEGLETDKKMEEVYSLPKISSPTLRQCVKNLFNANQGNMNEKHDQGIIARILIKNNHNSTKMSKIFNTNH